MQTAPLLLSVRWGDLVDPRVLGGRAGPWLASHHRLQAPHRRVFAKHSRQKQQPCGWPRWVLSDDVRAMRGKWPSSAAKPSSAEPPLRPFSRRGRPSFSRRRALPNGGWKLCTGAEYKRHESHPYKLPSPPQGAPARPNRFLPVSRRMRDAYMMLGLRVV